jgi:hypothetical protein
MDLVGQIADAALTADSRRTLVKSCRHVHQGAFAAGLSIPASSMGSTSIGNIRRWATPTTTAPNFTSLLAEFRTSSTQGAADGKLPRDRGPGRDKFSKIEIGKIHASLDAVYHDLRHAGRRPSPLPCPLAASAADPTARSRYDTDHAVLGWLSAGRREASW